MTRGALYALILGLASTAHAEFSWELAGALRHTERAEFFEADGFTLEGTYFFAPVDDDAGPYALASFLDPATRMTIAARQEEQTAPASGQSIEAERELRNWSIDGRYLLPESKWYFGGRYSRGEIDLPSTTSIVDDGTGYGALAGKYFGRGATRLELAFDRSTVDSAITTQFCLFGICSPPRTTTLETTADTARIGVMHVRRGRALTYSLFGDVAETRPEVKILAAPPPAGVTPVPPTFIAAQPPGGFVAADSQELERRRNYTVGAELFPARKLGVRIGYKAFDGITEDDAYDVGATWFFRRDVGVGLNLSRQEFDYGLPSNDSATFHVIGRL